MKTFSISVLAALLMSVSAPVFAKDAAQPPKANADMQAVLDALASLKPKPIETLSAEDARQQPTPADAVKIVMKQKGLDPDDKMGVTTKDLTYPTGQGTQNVRVYFPEGADPKTPLPVVVYYHGGGFVIADIDVYDASPRTMAKMTNSIFVSVEYRHAPEDKFPAAFDDAFAAYKWTLENAASWGGDVKQVAVMGESAGGALALATTIKARDTKVQLPVSEVLVYPIGGVDVNTPSYQQNANAKPLSKPMMQWFVEKTLATEEDKNDPRVDAIGKADFKGLPPTTLVLAKIDPLHSDGERLGEKLKKAGVKTSVKSYKGVTHEFFGMGAVVASAKEAEAFAAGQLKASFTAKPSL